MSAALGYRLGLLAFIATAVVEVAGSRDLASSLSTALGRLVVFYGLGWVLGLIGDLLAEELAQQDFAALKAQADEAVT